MDSRNISQFPPVSIMRLQGVHLTIWVQILGGTESLPFSEPLLQKYYLYLVCTFILNT